MNRLLHLFYILILALFTSCQNQEAVPQNNNFSYLDSIKVANQNANNENTTASEQEIPINCVKIHRELLGNIFQKSERIKNTNDFKTYITLTLNTILNLECDKNQQLKVEQVELKLSPDFNIDQYLGYSVMVVGEISTTDDVNYPVKMEVLRIEPMKGAMQ